MSDQDLLRWGVPTEWRLEIRQVDEDRLLVLAAQLPAEASEALIELATSGTTRRPQTAPAGADPIAHPDAQRSRVAGIRPLRDRLRAKSRLTRAALFTRLAQHHAGGA